MKHTKKFLALVLSLAVVASLAAAGTLAWLTSETGTVTNTFKVGTDSSKVVITLDEADGKGGRTETGREYQDVLPGATLEKDPTVTVKANSADCYVYVAVKNDLTGITIADLNEDLWEEVGATDKGATVYKFKTVAGNSNLDSKLVVFEHVTVSSELTNETLRKAVEDGSITIAAYAIQALNIDADTATANAIAWFNGENA